MYPNATHASEHFTFAEWDKRGVSTPAQREAFVRLCKTVLEPLRDHYGRPVHITDLGGVRHKLEQQAVWDKAVAEAHGDVDQAALHAARPGHSRHEVGDAADVWIDLVAPQLVATYCATLTGVGGVGHYGSFTHVDARPRVKGVVARW